MNKKIDDVFLDGFMSGKGGLTIESNPHPLLLNQFPDGREIKLSDVKLGHFEWVRGWNLGKFVAIEELRKIKHEQIIVASNAIKSNQHEYSNLCELANLGFSKAGFRSLWADYRLGKMSNAIRNGRDFSFLKELQIEVYLPWRPSEEPYEIKFFDGQKDLKNVSHFLEVYGDLHGVRSAWLNYIHADLFKLLNK